MLRILILLCCGYFSQSSYFETYQDDYIVHLNNENFDELIHKPIKPWFILFCRFPYPQCTDLKPIWRTLAEKYHNDYNIAQLTGIEFSGIFRRLSLPTNPAFYLTFDGINFIQHIWPRGYDDLEYFMTEGYKNVTHTRYKRLDPESSLTYYKEATLYILQNIEKQVDSRFQKLGLRPLSKTTKIIVLITVICLMIALLLHQVYLCIWEPIKQPEFRFKNKID